MKRIGLGLLLFVFGVQVACAAGSNCLMSIPDGPLDSEFASPPRSAQPRAYFFLTDLSAEHFPSDIAAMSRSGLSGLMYMHAGGGSLRMPKIDRALTEPWMKSIRALMRSAKDNGMEFSISLADSNGNGGPWITEDYAAKKLVYSESQVDGPARNVVPPPAVGPYMLPWEATFKRYKLPTFYRDVAILAFREALGTPMRPAVTTASSSNIYPAGENFWPVQETADRDPQSFWKSLQPDKKKEAREKAEAAEKAALAKRQGQKGQGTGVVQPPPVAKPAEGLPKAPATEQEWVQHSYREPIAAVGAVVVGGLEGGPWSCELQASDDEKAFNSISTFTLAKGERKDLRFAETPARHFRLVMTIQTGKEAELAELCLLRKDEIVRLRPGNQWWLFKSGTYAFASIVSYPKQGQAVLAEEYPADQAPADVKSEDIIDLTDKVTADGKLAWDVPPGRWTILRFGYNTQGAQARNYIATVNQPITEVPYEADVLSPRVAEYSFNLFALPVIKAALEETGKPPAYFHQDSWEGGASGARGIQPTWTDDFAEKFNAKRGYNLRKYLPVMARRLVDSREASDRFMWDYRRTIADLWADFYARFQELCEAHGTVMTAQCGYGTYPFPHMDGLQTGGRVGLPQGEFWCYPWEVRNNGENYHRNDVCDYLRNAASAAHVYGHSLLTAESLTCCRGILNMAPLDSPSGGERNGFKTYLDDAFTKGLNTYQMLAWNHSWDDDVPVTHFTHMMSWATMGRQLSWINQAPAWHTYIARCQSLLRRGWPVVDVAYFTGEGSCSYVKGRDFLHPAMAEGYEYGGINTEVLLTRTRVKNGRIELSGDPKGTWDKGPGMSYALLVFAEDLKVMSPVLLARLKELIEAGATVICPKPERAQGLGQAIGDDRKLKELADAMWGAGQGVAGSGQRAVGKGVLAWGKTPAEVLQAMQLPPDVEVRGLAKKVLLPNGKLQTEAKVRWGHRRAEGVDIYFVVNHACVERAFTAVFRVAGRQPEFFDPVTGETRALPEFKEEAGRTAVPMRLAPYQSGFVVFGERSQNSEFRIQNNAKNFPELKPVLELAGPWTVQFNPKWGGPKEPVVFDKLVDWTERPEEGIKYYSGMATYRKIFDLPSGVRSQKSEVRMAGTNNRQPITSNPSRFFLDLGNVKSLAEVAVNGKELGVVWCHPMRVAIPDGLLKAKGNELEIRPVNPWNNRIVGDGLLPADKKVLKYTGTSEVFLPPHPSAKYKLMPAGLLGPVRLLGIQ
jgi:hypothetical protein